MEDAPEVDAGQAAGPEDLVGQVRHAAEEIVESLDEAGGDEQTRHGLLHTLATELGHQGIRLVDTHDLPEYAPELDPAILNGKPGAYSGRTRRLIFLDLAIIKAQGRRRRGR